MRKRYNEKSTPMTVVSTQKYQLSMELLPSYPRMSQFRIWKKSVGSYFLHRFFVPFFQWRFIRTWATVIFIPGWASLRTAPERSPEAPIPLLYVPTPFLLQEILLQVFQLEIHAARIDEKDQRTWLGQQFRYSGFGIGFRYFYQRPLWSHWPTPAQKWSMWLRQNRWNQNHDRYLKNF